MKPRSRKLSYPTIALTQGVQPIAAQFQADRLGPAPEFSRKSSCRPLPSDVGHEFVPERDPLQNSGSRLCRNVDDPDEIIIWGEATSGSKLRASPTVSTSGFFPQGRARIPHNVGPSTVSTAPRTQSAGKPGAQGRDERGGWRGWNLKAACHPLQQ
jgi:hypothetical protein